MTPQPASIASVGDPNDGRKVIRNSRILAVVLSLETAWSADIHHSSPSDRGA